MASDDDSSGMLSRVNRNSATTVNINTAIPCASGVIACNTSSQLSLRLSRRRPYPSSHLLRNECCTTIAAHNSRHPIVETLEVIDVPMRDTHITLK